MLEEPFEVWENDTATARFVFSHSSQEFTTGVLILKPGASLPKHNRPKGFENLTQLFGTSEMTVYKSESEREIEKVVELKSGDVIKMDKGQWHVHANNDSEVSVTFFKLVGDITEIMDMLRKTNKSVRLRHK